MNQVKIPIIILNWNGLSDTIECITSVLQMKKFPMELILVDNGSDLEEQQELKKIYDNNSQVKLIFNEKNKGFTKGTSDIVFEFLKRDNPPPFVVLLNNDTVVSPTWLSSLVNTAISQKADIVSSKMINYYDRNVIDNLGHFMLNTGEILPFGHGKPKEKYIDQFQNLGACGGAALYRTSMIKKMGFFDDYFNTGYEDAEFGLRGSLLGYKCIVDPQAIVYHKVSRSINKIKDAAYLQNIQTNILYTYVKLMPTRFLIFNLPFVFFKYLLWFLFGIFTIQLGLIKLHISTLYYFFKKHLKEARLKRKEFYKIFNPVHRKSILAPTQFFIMTDLKRLMARIFP